jgi:hypothetical protein
VIGGCHIEVTHQLSLLRTSWKCACHLALSSFSEPLCAIAAFFRPVQSPGASFRTAENPLLEAFRTSPTKVGH